MNLIEKLKKKRVKWYERERIPALDNALRDAVYHDHRLEGYLNDPFIQLAEYFFGCGFNDFYTLDVTYPREVDMYLVPMLEKFITENYTSHNGEITGYLKKMIGEENLNRLSGRYEKAVGFNHRYFGKGGEEFSSLLSSGCYFMENSKGTKIAMKIISSPTERILPFTHGQLTFSLYADGRVDGVKEVCESVIKTINNRLYSSLKDSGYAMGGNGAPVKIQSLSWDDLKISESIKKEIRFHISGFISRITSFKDAGVKPSRGIIVAGPPGTGKTMLGKILCSTLNVPFFFATSEDFIVGNNVNIANLYRSASFYSPSIVFIEDADIFLQQRQFNSSFQTLSAFLNLVDGLAENRGVITILTCNNPELLDEAVKNRPKRFDVIIEFPYPGPEERLEILMTKLSRHLDGKGIEAISDAAVRMDGFSGAHLAELSDRLIMSKIYADSEIITGEMIEAELANFSFTPTTEKTIGIR